MVVCISQSTLLRSCDRRAKGGEEHDIVRVLLENVLEAFLCETCHWSVNAALNEEQTNVRDVAHNDMRGSTAKEAGEVLHSCRTFPCLLQAKAPDTGVRQVSAGRKLG